MGAQVFRDFTKVYPVIVRGKGVFLYDRAGREYLDAVGGISVGKQKYHGRGKQKSHSLGKGNSHSGATPVRLVKTLQETG